MNHDNKNTNIRKEQVKEKIALRVVDPYLTSKFLSSKILKYKN